MQPTPITLAMAVAQHQTRIRPRARRVRRG